MDNKDLSEALKKILEKEIKKFGSLIPKDIVTDIESKICLLYTSPSPRDNR